MNHHINFLVTVLLVLSVLSLYSQEEKVDAGIFSGVTPDTLIIKARPTYQVPGQSMTNAQVTVKWSESSPVTELQWLYTSIGLFPQGPVIVYEGFRYQVYGSFGGSSINWAAGQEYTILKLKTGSQTGACTEFEIAQDDWTLNNNGDYYIEILGEDRTGIRYVPSVNFGSDGGYVDGDTTIYLGGSTGVMSLTGYNGNILHWERKINQGTWDILPETAGLVIFQDTPTLHGTWEYRARVEKTGCPPPQYSEPAIITVELLAIWTGAVNTNWEDPGNWNVVGVPDSTLDGKIPVVSTGLYPLINSEAICKNLLIEENASVTIAQEGTLTLTGFLENDGSFLMQSYTISSASFIDNGIIGDGTFSTKLIFNPGYYHLFSSPVINSTSGSFEGMYLYRWDEPSGQYTPITSGDDTLEVFNGYLATNEIPGLDIVIFEGSGLFTGLMTTNLTNNGNGNGHSGGFNLAGNPYPSAINWNDEENLILEQIDPALYILDGESGNYGTYLRHDNGSSTLGIDSIIGMHQGFFVHVQYTSSTGSMSLNNNLRFHDHRPLREEQVFRSDEPYLKLQVTAPGGSLKDEIVARFQEGASVGFDILYDAYDISGLSSSPQLFTRCPDTLRLAVNTYPPLVLNTAIPLGFQAGSEGAYTFHVEDLQNLGPDTLVLLEDLALDTTYQLSPEYELEFNAAPTDDPDRFILHFQVEPVNIPDYSDIIDVKIGISGRTVNIYSAEEKFSGTFEMTDLTGRLVLKQWISGLLSNVDCNCEEGIYIIKIYGNGGVFSNKVFINPHN